MINGSLHSAITAVADQVADARLQRPAVVGVRSPDGEHLVTASGPMSVETPFHLASVGKVFTAVLIMQLVDEGRIDLDAPVAESRVLDTADPAMLHPWFQQITMRHLLTHTSGWRDVHNDDPTYLADGTGRPAPGAFIRRFASSVVSLASGGDDEFARRRWAIWDEERPSDPEAGVLNRFVSQGYALAPLAVPGTQFHYSDTGYQLAAMVLERLGEAPYHRQQRLRILEPLGLTHTAMAYGDVVDLLPTTSEVFIGDQPIMALGCDLAFDWGGGGQVASIDDLLRFGHAVFSGELLSAESLEIMLNFITPPGLIPPRQAVSIGLQRWTTPGGRTLEGHSGAWGARLFRDPTSGWIVAGSSHQRDDGAWLDAVLTAIEEHRSL